MTRETKDPTTPSGPFSSGPNSGAAQSSSFQGRAGFVQRHLDPASRMGEVLFGLIMVLTMTLTAEVAAGGHAPAHELLAAAIGCNIAWGIIDAFMYLMHILVTRGESVRLARAVREAPTPDNALATIQDQVGEELDPLLPPDDRTHVYQRIRQHLLESQPTKPSLTRKDFFGAIACFWLVFLSCLPAAVPFLLVSDPVRALRISNALLLVMLFLVGYRWAAYAGTNRFAAGFISLAVGLLLVGVAILLGG